MSKSNVYDHPDFGCFLILLGLAIFFGVVNMTSGSCVRAEELKLQQKQIELQIELLKSK